MRKIVWRLTRRTATTRGGSFCYAFGPFNLMAHCRSALRDLIRGRPSVDVVEAVKVSFVDRTEGDLEYPYRGVAGGRKAMRRGTRNENPIPHVRPHNRLPQLYLCPGVEHHPQLIVAMMILQREHTARLDGYDLDGRQHVVRVLLEFAPGLHYLYGRRCMIVHSALSYYFY